MEKGGGPQSPPLQAAVATEQIRNLQECTVYTRLRYKNAVIWEEVCCLLRVDVIIKVGSDINWLGVLMLPSRGRCYYLQEYVIIWG